MKVKAKLYVGEKQAQITQNFQSLFEVAKLALGDGKDSKPENDPKVAKPQSGAELQASFWEVFG